jgi:hypothetical protein
VCQTTKKNYELNWKTNRGRRVVSMAAGGVTFLTTWSRSAAYDQEFGVRV